MEVIGKVKVLKEQETFGTNGFRKRELVVETAEQYPQPILIEFVQDKCDLLDPCYEGDGVTVSINLRGREWLNPAGEAKYFNSIQGWKIKLTDESATRGGEEQESAEPLADEKDDLPF